MHDRLAEILVQLLCDGDAPPHLRIAAQTALIHRGWKP